MNRRENVLKVCYEVNEEEEKQMEARSPAFIEKDRLTASPPVHPSPGARLMFRVIRILRQSAATEVTLPQGQRRPNGWLRCSLGHHHLRFEMPEPLTLEPLTLQERFSVSQATEMR